MCAVATGPGTLTPVTPAVDARSSTVSARSLGGGAVIGKASIK